MSANDNLFYICFTSHTESELRLFTDDSLLYREIRNTNASIQLQEDQNALEGWKRNGS